MSSIRHPFAIIWLLLSLLSLQSWGSPLLSLRTPAALRDPICPACEPVGPACPIPAHGSRFLSERTDGNNLDQRVLDLWKQTPPNRRAPVGGEVKVWSMDSQTLGVPQGLFSTGECFGCTVALIVSGKKIIIGHFKEVGQMDKSGEQFDAAVLDPIEEAIHSAGDDIKQNPYLVFFYPAAIPGLQAKLDLIEQSVRDSIGAPNNPMHETIRKSYQKLFAGADAFDTTSAGKILAEFGAWKRNGHDGYILNVYCESERVIRQHYSATQSACTCPNDPGDGVAARGFDVPQNCSGTVFV